MKNAAISFLETPIGTLKIIGDAEAIRWVAFTDEPARSTDGKLPSVVRTCKYQLKEYFDGKRKSFEIALDTDGTDFQKNVWSLLQQIPFGKTSTYVELAEKIGDSKKMRAIGQANGKNPLAILIPCHRVIGSSGSLTGYAWGIERKEWLLKHEHSIPSLTQLNLFK